MKSKDTTIRVSKETQKNLKKLKVALRLKSLDDVIYHLVRMQNSNWEMILKLERETNKPPR